MNYRCFAYPGSGVSQIRPGRAAGWPPPATVADITRPSAATAGEYDHVAAAAYLTKRARPAAFVVLGVRHGSRPTGVITQADIARAVADGMDVNKTRIHDLLTARPAAIRAAASIRDAARTMVAVSTPCGPTVLLLSGPAFSGAGVGVLL